MPQRDVWLTDGVPRIIADLAATSGDPSVWLALALTLVFGAIATSIGLVVGRRTGMIEPSDPIADQLGVGAALGLIACATAYATVRSSGRTAYVPTAAFLAIAVVVGRGRIAIGRPRPRWLPLGIAAGVLVASTALLYGVTVAPSPRDGLQPITFM